MGIKLPIALRLASIGGGLFLSPSGRCRSEADLDRLEPVVEAGVVAVQLVAQVVDSAAQVSHVGQRARVTRCVGGRGQSAVGFRPAQVEAAFFAVERTTGASDPDSGPRLQRAGDGIRDQVEYPQRHRSDADGTARRSDHALADGGAAADPRCDGAGPGPPLPPPVPLPQTQPPDVLGPDPYVLGAPGNQGRIGPSPGK